jgi:hypothetical protein
MDRRIVRRLMCGCLLLAAGGGGARAQAAAEPIGLFSDHSDVGTVLHPGSVAYDTARRSYTISGSGENVWAEADAFQFVWKKMEGDFTLTADISVLGQGGDPHKKAMLMARQSLDADSAYADVALHGVGLTSLQARDAKGADTHEIQSNISAPKRLRLQKYNGEFTMWLAGEDGQFRMAGGSMRVPMTGAFYVGLGVCAHNKDAVERAEFGNVALGEVSSEWGAQLYTSLETVDVASTDRRVTYVKSSKNADIIRAPNWTPDGASLLFGYGLAIERVPVSGGEPKMVCTGELSVGDDHSISPDGKLLGFSGVEPGFGSYSAMYIVPIGGGAPRRVTAKSPAFWQDWSPDGKTILFLLTDDQYRFGIYTMPVAGGTETRLIGGPAASIRGSAGYSPDGNYIYFHSNRSGAAEVWRMRSDGSHPEQVTRDGAGNWYPHVSPDGRLLAFLTARQQGADGSFLAPIALRVMTLADGHVRVVAKFTGSNNSMPAPSWSPDSRRLAFMSYQGVGPDTDRPRMFAPKKIVK